MGIAIGAGSDVAVETAGLILVRSNPLDVVAIVRLSRATYQKMIQNLLCATGYNVVAIRWRPERSTRGVCCSLPPWARC